MKLISLAVVTVIIGGAAATFVEGQELAPDVPTPQAAVMEPAKPDVDALAASVTRALKESRDVPGSDIVVSTHAGIIVLTGKVDTETQRAAAASIAQRIASGVRITNSVEVKPVEERSPQEQQAVEQSVQLVRDVEAALKADQRTADLGVTVSLGDGQVVVLQGLVPTRDNRSVAQNIASRVKGVTRVDNRLMVP